MGIDITRKDVTWSYVAKLFQIGSGLVTLPLILHLLTSEEVGMNYLMLTVSSIVGLMDFGFSPQFGRNFTYVNSGAKTLCREGVSNESSSDVDWHLMSVLISTARYVYRRLSVLALMVMLTFGTAYIWYLTEGFTNVANSLPIWILYSFSTYFNIYFSYYSSLLTGSGMIRESSQAAILSKSVYLVLCTIFLLSGWGLFAVVAANFIAPFAFRYFAYKKYFTPELKAKLDAGPVTRKEIFFHFLWHTRQSISRFYQIFPFFHIISKSTLISILFCVHHVIMACKDNGLTGSVPSFYQSPWYRPAKAVFRQEIFSCLLRILLKVRLLCQLLCNIVCAAFFCLCIGSAGDFYQFSYIPFN